MRKTLLTTSALVAAIALGGAAQADNFGVGAGNINDQVNSSPQVSVDQIIGVGDILNNKLEATAVGNAASQTANNSGDVDVDGNGFLVQDPIGVGAGNLSEQLNGNSQEAVADVNNFGGPADLTKGNKLEAIAVGNSVSQKAKNSADVDVETGGVALFGFSGAVGAGNLNDQVNLAPQTATSSIDADWDVDSNKLFPTAVGNAAEQTAKAKSGSDVDSFTDTFVGGLSVAVGAGNASTQANDKGQFATASIDGGDTFVDAFDVTNNKLDAVAVGNSLSQKAVNEGAVTADSLSVPGSGLDLAGGALNLNSQVNDAPQVATSTIDADGLVSGNKLSSTAVGNAAEQVAKATSTSDVDAIGDFPSSAAGAGALSFSDQDNFNPQTATNSITSDAGNITNNVMTATAVGNSVSQTASNAGTVDVD